MVPKSLQGSDGRGVIDPLEEAAQSLALRSATLGIDHVIDIYSELGSKEFGETRVRKIKNLSSTPNEIYEVVYER